CARAGTPFAFW
nr:immunoglobulin heavy chain junction region [Mus musculus]